MADSEAVAAAGPTAAVVVASRAVVHPVSPRFPSPRLLGRRAACWADCRHRVLQWPCVLEPSALRCRPGAGHRPPASGRSSSRWSSPHLAATPVRPSRTRTDSPLPSQAAVVASVAVDAAASAAATATTALLPRSSVRPSPPRRVSQGARADSRTFSQRSAPSCTPSRARCSARRPSRPRSVLPPVVARAFELQLTLFRARRSPTSTRPSTSRPRRPSARLTRSSAPSVRPSRCSRWLVGGAVTDCLSLYPLLSPSLVHPLTSAVAALAHAYRRASSPLNPRPLALARPRSSLAASQTRSTSPSSPRPASSRRRSRPATRCASRPTSSSRSSASCLNPRRPPAPRRSAAQPVPAVAAVAVRRGAAVGPAASRPEAAAGAAAGSRAAAAHRGAAGSRAAAGAAHRGAVAAVGTKEEGARGDLVACSCRLVRSARASPLPSCTFIASRFLFPFLGSREHRVRTW